MTAKPGQFVDDNTRYRLDARIATGGMGEVWRATDTTLGREVAVKVLKAEYADDATFRQRFSTEAQHAASLHHPNVAAVYDVGESHQSGVDDGSGVPRPYLVMELVEGEPLSTLLKQGQDAGQRMSPVALRDLLAQAGDALGAAHRAGIVHRDVKPANLLVTPEGQLKITDFGIARAADSGGITQTGTVMGTPQYLSPEQAQGEPATVRSDVYSLGVVAYECLAGRRPFEADSPVATALAHIRTPVPDLPDDVPADLAAVVKRAMAKDPADRFADGAAFAAALRDPATAVTAVVAPPVPVPPPAPATQVMPATQQVRPTTTPTQAAPPDDDERRSPWAAILGALLVLALIVALLLWLANRDDEPDPVETTPSPTRTTETTPPETTEPTEEAGIEIDAGSYIGRPVDEVESELEGLGLNVKRDKVDNPGGEIEDLVSDVNPTGTLQEGDTVTVSYWGKAPEEEPEEPETEAPETEAPETQAPETRGPETSPPATGGALEGEPEDGLHTEAPAT